MSFLSHALAAHYTKLIGAGKDQDMIWSKWNTGLCPVRPPDILSGVLNSAD